MKLEDMKRLCDEATPGPWSASEEGYEVDYEYVYYVSPSHFSTKQIAAVNSDKAEHDSRFIAAARTLMPKLIKVVEEALEARDAYVRDGFVPAALWTFDEALKELESGSEVVDALNHIPAMLVEIKRLRKVAERAKSILFEQPLELGGSEYGIQWDEVDKLVAALKELES